MLSLRATKYNPKNRDDTGQGYCSEWISVSDIGSVFAGERLTPEAYLRVEDNYVKVVEAFLLALKQPILEITYFEKKYGEEHVPESILNLRPANLADIGMGSKLNKKEIGPCVRQNLREVLWCKLQGPSGIYIHFGYDFYMYLGCNEDVSLEKIQVDGIFLEPFPSPYH